MHFTRSKIATDYKAAGVLPLAFEGGQAQVLLGSELVRTGHNGKVWRTMCESTFCLILAPLLLAVSFVKLRLRTSSNPHFCRFPGREGFRGPA
jgi:hypothetical protein